MKCIRVGIACLAVAALALSSNPLAAGEPSPRMLVRWQVQFQGDPEAYSELLVYTDGLAIFKLVRPGEATYVRYRAYPGALERLRSKLTENRVGFQPDLTCELKDLFPAIGGTYYATVTWSGWRQSRFTLTTVGEPPRCSTEMQNIAIALRDIIDELEVVSYLRTQP